MPPHPISSIAQVEGSGTAPAAVENERQAHNFIGFSDCSHKLRGSYSVIY
jgi:hypothetical protein